MVKEVIELKILEEELIWDYTIVPKCNHAYPYRREAKGGGWDIHTQEKGGKVNTEAEFRVMQPQIKEFQGMPGNLQKLREARNQFSPRVSGDRKGECNPADTLTSDFWPPELWKNIFLLC